MKNRLLSIIIIFLISIASAIAQSNSRISFAVLGGLNFQNMTGRDFLGNDLANDMILGYHAGAVVNIPIVSEFYFQPGIILSTKGSKNVFGILTTTTRMSYLEIPLNIVYKAPLGVGYVMLGFGPYVAYGIGGKVTTEGGPVAVETSIEYKNIVESGDPIDGKYYKALDAGGNIFFGYELPGGIFAKINAQLGMLKINPEDQRMLIDQSSVKHTGFGFSLGYQF